MSLARSLVLRYIIMEFLVLWSGTPSCIILRTRHPPESATGDVWVLLWFAVSVISINMYEMK